MKEYIKQHNWPRLLGAGLLGLVIGASGSEAPQPAASSAVQTKVVTERVEVAPAACKQALIKDDEIFRQVGNHMGRLDFEGMASYLQREQGPRTALVVECMSK